jgi:predicted nuclease with TOPRIM domain
MQEFPKMLYIGSTQSHKPEIAQNKDHEDDLRELGFVDFADLESEVEHPEDFIMDMRTGKPKTVPQDVYDQVFADRQNLESENEELKDKLSTLDKLYGKAIDDFNASNDKYIDLAKKIGEEQIKYFEFQNNVEAMKARIAEIQGDTTPIGTASESPDYNSLTTPQLQKLLDEKGITYLKRDDKATLIGLLSQPVKAEE